MVQCREPRNLIKEFIHSQVAGRRLDERTCKAYRQDLELLFGWLESEGKEEEHDFEKSLFSGEIRQERYAWEENMEAYLEYLAKEKGLRFSTICRRYQVFGYFLSYLKREGVIEDFRPLRMPRGAERALADTLLTKCEVDAFFHAISQEYTELDSDFRKRVCLRDQVMMELLFYHGMEISELLQLEVSDYNRKTAVLTIRRKREKERSVYIFSKSLQGRMEQWLSVRDYFENGGLCHNRMFLSKLGRPLSMKMVTNIFDKYRMRAGIKKECTPKDLKNSLGRYGEELVREMG